MNKNWGWLQGESATQRDIRLYGHEDGIYAGGLAICNDELSIEAQRRTDNMCQDQREGFYGGRPGIY